MGVSESPATDRPVIAVIGEVVADAVARSVPPVHAAHDVVRDERSVPEPDTLWLAVHPGGGPANTALALARLGSVARFAGRLSTGTLGRLCRARLAASGVDLRASVDVPDPATLAIASLAADGSATYEFYAHGTADWGWTADGLAGVTDASLGARPVAVHAGSLALAMQPSGRAIESFLARARRASTVSIDPNLRTRLVPLGVYRDAIDRWATLADIIKLSSDDLEELWPGLALADAAQRLHDAGATVVIVTRGASGSYASLRRSGSAERYVTLESAAVPTVVADTVGAGDAFAAGLLHHLAAADALGGRLDELDPSTMQAAIEFAARVAAITCARRGADPPWAADLATRVDGSIGP